MELYEYCGYAHDSHDLGVLTLIQLCCQVYSMWTSGSRKEAVHIYEGRPEVRGRNELRPWRV